jgi:hypothetical protein
VLERDESGVHLGEVGVEEALPTVDSLGSGLKTSVDVEVYASKAEKRLMASTDSPYRSSERDGKRKMRKKGSAHLRCQRGGSQSRRRTTT